MNLPTTPNQGPFPFDLGLDPAPAAGPSDNEKALQEAVRLLSLCRRHWWFPTVLAALALVANIVLALMKPALYQTAGMVELGMFAEGIDLFSERSPGSMIYDTHRALLTSDAVVDDAMRRLGISLGDTGRREARVEFLEDIDIQSIASTYLVTVEATGHDPGAVANHANALLDSFVSFTTSFHLTRTEVQIQRLRDQEKDMLRELHRVEQRKEDFIALAGNIPYEQMREGLIASQALLHGRLTDQRIALALAEAESERLRRRLNDIKQEEDVGKLLAYFGDDVLRTRDDTAQSATATNSELNASQLLLARLRTQLAEIRQQLVAYEAEGTDRQRLLELDSYRELERRERNTKELFRQQLEEVGLASLTAQEENERTLFDAQQRLLKQYGELQEELKNLDRKERQYRSIAREERWYDRELEVIRGERRRLESRGQEREQRNATIVNRAEVPEQPAARINPKKLVAVVFLGFMMGIAMIIARDVFDDTMTRESQVTALGTPCLGVVPHLDFSELDELAHIRGSFWTAEAFSLIRTNISVAAGGLQNAAVMVTGSAPGDGKSFVSLNLAAALSRTGGRTLIIEADMRRPRIQQILASDHREGLSDVLAGRRPLTELVQETEFPGLELLAAGPCPLNPADLLLRGQFERLIQEATKTYDHVVIDAPPARPLADTSLMAPAVKGVVQVVRARISKRGLVKGAIEQIQGVARNNLGVILNDVTLEEAPDLQYNLGGYAYGGYYAPIEPGEEEEEAPMLFVVAPPDLTEGEADSPLLSREAQMRLGVLALLLAVLGGVLGFNEFLPGPLQAVFDKALGKTQPQPVSPVPTAPPTPVATPLTDPKAPAPTPYGGIPDPTPTPTPTPATTPRPRVTPPPLGQ